MFTRIFFIGQRFLGYAFVFFALVWEHADRPWWQFAIGIVAWMWGTLERWKRLDDSVVVIRRGVWLEFMLIVLWSYIVQDAWVLTLLLSPIARAGVHTSWRDSILVFSTSAVCVFGGAYLWRPVNWVPLAQIAVFLAVSGYSLVLGGLIRQRERLRRTLQLTIFEREQRVKDEERLRIATQLHDTVGQHWTAVIRALDVIAQVDGEQQQTFIQKVRDAATDGLSVMREVTHMWNEGRQTPDEWLEYAKESLIRLQDVTGLVVQIQSWTVEWNRFESPMQVAELVSRTLIEGATNAIRHGLAKHLVVILQPKTDHLELELQNDGTDIHQPEFGMGLSALSAMAASTGGELRLVTRPGHGVSLELKVPYGM